MFARNFKIIFTIVMFLEVFLGLIPAKCEACRKSVYPLSFLNCFSAGIFLSIAFVHILPDTTIEYIEWANENGYDEAFPLPTFMAMFGYILILLIDKVIAHSFKLEDEQHSHLENKPAAVPQESLATSNVTEIVDEMEGGEDDCDKANKVKPLGMIATQTTTVA